MKNPATGTVFDGSWGRDATTEPIPFFGFVTGALLSAAIWLGIGLALWIVRL